MQLNFFIFQDLTVLLNAISTMTSAVEPLIWWRGRAAPRGKGPSQCISHLLHFLSLPGPSPTAPRGGPAERVTVVCAPSPEGTGSFPEHLGDPCGTTACVAVAPAGSARCTAGAAGLGPGPMSSFTCCLSSRGLQASQPP